MHDPLLDTAEAVYAMVGRLPEWQRTAAFMLVDLPVDYGLCDIVGACSDPDCDEDPDCGHDREVVGTMTVGRLLVDLRAGIAAPEMVWRMVQEFGLARPGTPWAVA